MKLPDYGRALRSAFDRFDLDAQPEDVVHVLRESAADIGAAAADVFAAEVTLYAHAPAAARDLARLAVCSEIDRSLRSVMAEWAVPRSADTEGLVELAENAFNARLSALNDGQGGAQ